MKNTKLLESVVGGFVVFGMLCLVFLAYKVSNINKISEDRSYHLTADFLSISGLKKNASVTLSGVKIGQVKSIKINKENYKAQVTMLIDNEYNHLPIDSSISILTQGLLGEKYLGIDLGYDEEVLEDGDSFDLTKSAIVLERLIDKFILNSTKDK